MRFRLTVTAVREYTADPQNYPEGCSVEDMLRIDRESIADDPDIMLDHPDAWEEIQVEEIK